MIDRERGEKKNRWMKWIWMTVTNVLLLLLLLLARQTAAMCSYWNGGYGREEQYRRWWSMILIRNNLADASATQLSQKLLYVLASPRRFLSSTTDSFYSKILFEYSFVAFSGISINDTTTACLSLFAANIWRATLQRRLFLFQASQITFQWGSNKMCAIQSFSMSSK